MPTGSDDELLVAAERIVVDADCGTDSAFDCGADRVAEDGIDSLEGIDEHAAPLAEDDEIPAIGGYSIVERIGSGMMGVVFKARNDAVDKTLAVKLMRKNLANDPVNLRRFREEAKAASFLTHANLVGVYGHGITGDGAPYIIMDYVDGISLQELLSREGYLDTERFLNIFIQVCEALEHAHAKRIVHRDLKPSNIMIVKADQGLDHVKVVDFGIAKVMEEGGEHGNLTQTGELLGSPLYMSPEQCLGNPLDARSDIYSLGCVMYEALTGKAPFLGDNVVQTIFKHLNERPPELRSVRPYLDLPAGLENLIFLALEREADDRFQNIAQLRQGLEDIRDGRFPKVRRTFSWQRIRRRTASMLKSRTRATIVALTSICLSLCCLAAFKYQLYTNERAILHELAQVTAAAQNAKDFEELARYWKEELKYSEAAGRPKQERADIMYRLAGLYAQMVPRPASMPVVSALSQPLQPTMTWYYLQKALKMGFGPPPWLPVENMDHRIQIDQETFRKALEMELSSSHQTGEDYNRRAGIIPKLVDVYVSQGDWKALEDLGDEYLGARLSYLGARLSYPSWPGADLHLLLALEEHYVKTGNYAAAERLMRYELAVTEKTEGWDWILMRKKQYVDLLMKLGRKEDARRFEKHTALIQAKLPRAEDLPRAWHYTLGTSRLYTYIEPAKKRKGASQ